jgi:hypothetical protein
MIRKIYDELSLSFFRLLRRNTLLVTTFITFLLFADVIALLLSRKGQLRKLFGLLSSDVIAVMAAGLALIVTTQLLLRYLKNDSNPKDRLAFFELTEAMARIRKLERAAGGLDAAARKALIEDLKSDASTQLITEFEGRLQQRYGASMEVTLRAKHVRKAADRMLERLQAETRALMRRGNLNLVLGIVITAAAASLLAYVALTARLTVDDWRRDMPTFLLRLSTVAFIEVFAFFFLRLYRNSLSEIKYFQNEITNLEAKCLALEFATLVGDLVSAGKVVEELAKTERNFVLKKDETTIELERAKLDSDYFRQAVNFAKGLIPDKGSSGVQSP